MTRSTSVHICFLVCLTCFAAAAICNDEEVDPNKIHLIFYHCDATDERNECSILDVDCIERAHKLLRKDKNETTVFTHGYNGSNKTRPVPEFIAAYCSQNVSAITTIDWSPLAKGDVIAVINRIPKVAKIIASTFDFLNNKGYEIAKWHLIGHSTGAHIVGCIGNYSNFKFLHITGLDPAGAFFYTDRYDDCQMNPKVALFTDVLYTDRGGFATMEHVGSLNIYANTGTASQPDCCSLDTRKMHECSHIKAATWYADTVTNGTKYLATKCENCFMFLHFDYCRENYHIYIGPHVDTQANGIYCARID